MIMLVEKDEYDVRLCVCRVMDGMNGIMLVMVVVVGFGWKEGKFLRERECVWLVIMLVESDDYVVLMLWRWGSIYREIMEQKGKVFQLF